MMKGHRRRDIENEQPQLKLLHHKMQMYCAYRERCKSEIINKIKSLNGEIYLEEILNKLKEDNFWSEDRFISQYILDKFELSNWGFIKIIIGLKQRMISESQYEILLPIISTEDYNAKIDFLINRKRAYFSDEESPYVVKDKIYKYLLQKGFEPENIWPILNKIILT